MDIVGLWHDADADEMIFKDFEIHASPFITNATCRECRNDCYQAPNGFFGKVLFCPTCEIVYEIKMVKIPSKKIDNEFIEQCRAANPKKPRNTDDPF